MSDNKNINIRGKFESEEYLKNFIPNNEDKNRFFEFYEEQEIKKSLKEKFLHQIETLTGWRIGEYKNFTLLR